MNRNGIIKHIENYKTKLGSYAAVARKCGINVGALSTILSGKYGANEDKMLQKIATELNYKETTWKLAQGIMNYRIIETVYEDAKEESMWFAISEKAGSCKSATLEDIYNNDKTGTVVFIQAEEWSGRQFLTKLIEKTQGELPTKGGYRTLANLMDIAAGFFNDMSLDKPVLLIDEVDKLKPSALRTLIPLFNRTEDRLGVIVSGTENFEKEMKQGVRLHKKGFDELESRFGRSYIHLKGATEKEVYAICQINGLTEAEQQANVWHEAEKVQKLTSVKTPTGTKDIMVSYVEDFRRLKRLIKRELLIIRKAA